MNRRQIAGLVFIGLVIVGMLAFFINVSGKSADNKAAEAKSDIGIIDLKAAAKYHPDYGRLQELRRELNTLQAEYDSMQGLEMTEPERAEVNADKLAQAESAQAVQRNMMNDMGMRKELVAKRQELRQAAADEMAAAVEAVNAEYMPQIFNIQLKLENLRLDDEVRNKYEADRQELYAQREAAIQERKQAIDARYRAELDSERAEVAERSAADLKAQTERQASESAAHSARVEAANEAAAAEEQQKFSPLKLAATQEAIEAKSREVAELEDKIRSDVAARAMKVAIEHKLTTVIAPTEHVNISAVDITDFVIAEFTS